MTRRGGIEPLVVDVAVIGAGIAGLWLANLVAQRGFSVALCDDAPVGGIQTAACQGIIHSGAKYTLGAVGGAPTALAGMPARWRACLAGNGEVDLRGVAVAAEHMQVHTLDATPRMKESSARVPEGHRLACETPPRLKQLADFALDVPSLIRRLAAPLRHRLLAARVAADSLALGPAGVEHITVGGCRLCAGAYLFAAGVGNEALARSIGASRVAMRRRALRQTCVRLRREAPKVFAHCFAPASGAAPELTVTSHGRTLYVGGVVADDGAACAEAEHVAVVRALLARHLPAMDLTGAVFDTLLIDRAEPAAGGLWEEADAFVARHGNCLICWPVKLSLAPRLGDKVLTELRVLRPAADTWPGNAAAALRYATPPWEREPSAGEREGPAPRRKELA